MAVGYSSIDIGDFKRVATLLKDAPSDTFSGTQIENYTTVLTTRCSLRRVSGGFTLDDGSLTRDRTYEMICRYQLSIVIDTDSMWKIGNDIYGITDYYMVDNVPHFYKFILVKSNA